MLNDVKDFKFGYNPFLAAIEITHVVIIGAVGVVIAIMKTLVEIAYKVIKNGVYIMYKKH